jgi:hypothetical protein
MSDVPPQPVADAYLLADLAAKQKNIARLVRRLRRRNPVRRITESLLFERRPLTPEEFECLLAAVPKSSDSRWKERAVTAWVFSQAELTEEQAARSGLARRFERSPPDAASGSDAVAGGIVGLLCEAGVTEVTAQP